MLITKGLRRRGHARERRISPRICHQASALVFLIVELQWKMCSVFEALIILCRLYFVKERMNESFSRTRTVSFSPLSLSWYVLLSSQLIVLWAGNDWEWSTCDWLFTAFSTVKYRTSLVHLSQETRNEEKSIIHNLSPSITGYYDFTEKVDSQDQSLHLHLSMFNRQWFNIAIRRELS